MRSLYYYLWMIEEARVKIYPRATAWRAGPPPDICRGRGGRAYTLGAG